MPEFIEYELKHIKGRNFIGGDKASDVIAPALAFIKDIEENHPNLTIVDVNLSYFSGGMTYDFTVYYE